MENTYEAGYDLAKRDIKRFGALHAMDKVNFFEGDFEKGYAAAIADKKE